MINNMGELRLQKFLSQAGICSRRQGEAYIAAGRVQVNGIKVTTLGTKIDPSTDQVVVDGRPVAVSGAWTYIALNKPKGYISSCRHAGQSVVVELIDLPQRLFPIGRLDKDSIGLLLLTDDGRLHHQLSHPGFDHEKEYEVSLERPIDAKDLQRMADGIMLKGRKTRPAKIKRLSGRRFRIVLLEGRNRQIRRMVRHLGHSVKRLKRVRVANVRLGNLPPGGWRHLSPHEKKILLRGINE